MRQNNYFKALFGSVLFCMFVFSIVVTTEAIPDEIEIVSFAINGETIIFDSDSILLNYEQFYALKDKSRRFKN